MFGRQARLPIDIDTEAIANPSERLEEFNHRQEPDQVKIQQQRRVMQTIVKSNIESAQNKQKQHYDQKHNAPGSAFNVGCLVLKKDFTRKKRKGGKLDSRWLGPYRLASSLGKGLFGPPEGGPILFLLSPEVSGTSGTMSIYIYIYIYICQQHGGRKVGM